jgi:hypothetical protein
MIQNKFKYFEFIKSEGFSSEVVYLEAKKQQLNYFTCIRMLRSVYNLSLPEAKTIIITADNKIQNTDESSFDILNRHQRNLIKTFKIAAKLIEMMYSVNVCSQTKRRNNRKILDVQAKAWTPKYSSPGALPLAILISHQRG